MRGRDADAEEGRVAAIPVLVQAAGPEAGFFHNREIAADAVEAAMILDSERFHTALVDLNLPSINGRELCRQIKSSQPDCITILLTNREGVEKSDGVDYVMLRPLDEDIVRNYIRE